MAAKQCSMETNPGSPRQHPASKGGPSAQHEVVVTHCQRPEAAGAASPGSIMPQCARPHEFVLCCWIWGRSGAEQLPSVPVLLPPSPQARARERCQRPEHPPTAAQRAPYAPPSHRDPPAKRVASGLKHGHHPKKMPWMFELGLLPGTARAAVLGPALRRSRAHLNNSSVPKALVQSGFGQELARPGQQDGHLGLPHRAATPAAALTCPKSLTIELIFPCCSLRSASCWRRGMEDPGRCR